MYAKDILFKDDIGMLKCNDNFIEINHEIIQIF